MWRGGKRRARGSGHSTVRTFAHTLGQALALSLLLVATLSLPTLAREVRVAVDGSAGGRAQVEYGERHRGDVVVDTLRFVLDGGQGAMPLHAVDTETTCDCVSGSVLDDGSVLLHLEIEAPEPDGPIEKVLYVFTNTPDVDLVRVLIGATVLPGGYEADTTGLPAQETSATPLDSLSDNALRVGFFYSPGCQSCRRVKDYTLPHLAQSWGARIALEEVNIDAPAGFARLMAVREHYHITDHSSPFLFAVGDTALVGHEDLAARLDRAIQRSLDRGTTTFLADSVQAKAAPAKARSVFRSLSFWAVVGAGLLDGLNPCAFATIVFFIGLLGYSGSTRRQMVVVGVGFTVSVFAVYLLLGLGAFRALQALAVYGIIARGLFFATFLLLLVLFALSLRDLVQYWRTGATKDQALQLPLKTKQRIHKVMRKGLKTRNLLLGAVGIGALVTLFEAACTGQVYLPTIVLVLKDPALRGHAVFYLVFYNLLFIAPLVLVFLLAYAGVASDRFASWSKRNYGLTRLLLTLLFLGLAVLMAGEAFHL